MNKLKPNKLSDSFYSEIKSFRQFSQLIDQNFYHHIPRDWQIILTDIKGSTKAIEQGRYKDVNTIGVAAIACIQNILGKIQFPFVFGGDGATILVPPYHLDKIKAALIGLQEIAHNNFSLELRVAMIEVSEVLQNKSISLEVAKYEITPGKSLAMFKGGGLTQAENLIKENILKYQIVCDKSESPNLQGLSCRWNPIPSIHGKVMAIMVSVIDSTDHESFSEILTQLDLIFKGKMEEHNPVRLDVMNYKSFKQCLSEEWRYHNSKLSLGFFLRALEIFAAVIIFKFGIHPVFFSPQRYAHSMRLHSDFRKYDDTLRMILDASAEQKTQIESFLQHMFLDGKIYYGIHYSDNALMTCLVQNLNDGGHVHFIDGGDGGYALAAKMLKSQKISSRKAA